MFFSISSLVRCRCENSSPIAATSCWCSTIPIIRAAAGSGPADTAYLLPMDEVVWLVIADEASLVAAIEALAAE